jgi:hypothetical protein
LSYLVGCEIIIFSTLRKAVPLTTHEGH